jgi:glycine cleavage system transcriptional repressor
MQGTLLSVTVVGQDRPGIVASIARSLFEHGCNLEDATSTILRGNFAMVLIVRAPADRELKDLQEGLDAAARSSRVSVAVGELDAAATDVSPPTHMVSVYGADRPGIVFRVAEELARQKANVTDLTSRVIGSDEQPVYALMLEVAAPEGADLEASLESLKTELGVDVTVHPIETDVL